MKVNNIDKQNLDSHTMEEESVVGSENSIKDIWNRLPLVMKIAVVVGDLFVLGFLIYYFTS
jgi:hypothetical protein